eukprot:Ihof_evm4s340 gene=Ihof_evmTU4s340
MRSIDYINVNPMRFVEDLGGRGGGGKEQRSGHRQLSALRFLAESIKNKTTKLCKKLAPVIHNLSITLRDNLNNDDDMTVQLTITCMHEALHSRPFHAILLIEDTIMWLMSLGQLVDRKKVNLSLRTLAVICIGSQRFDQENWRRNIPQLLTNLRQGQLHILAAILMECNKKNQLALVSDTIQKGLGLGLGHHRYGLRVDPNKEEVLFGEALTNTI